jgi:hypothetical protein
MKISRRQAFRQLLGGLVAGAFAAISPRLSATTAITPAPQIGGCTESECPLCEEAGRVKQNCTGKSGHTGYHLCGECGTEWTDVATEGRPNSK